MKNILQILILSLSFPLLLSGCADTPSEYYEGANYVTFNLTDAAVFDLTEGEGVLLEVNMSLPREEDTKISFKLEEVNAREGVDYVLSTKQVIIPKGKQVGELIIQALEDTEENFESRSVTIRIIEVSAPEELVIGYENGTVYSSLLVNFRDNDCPVLLSERYRGEVVQSTFGAVGDGNHVFPARLEEISNGVYRFNNIWGDYVAYLTENPEFSGGFPVTMDFRIDEQGNVTIIDAQMVGFEDVEILVDEMEAIYDPCEDRFLIHMVQVGLFSDDPYDIYTEFTP
ncbi:hypothetical protein [Persicobacter diffluens]|uniref:Calx-beta domain-containing protein n=1 Tax=Persicobacter diffluens TaxID=981 RepID=A0AAN4VWB4_9BACT|nr:hypothetical protein PEDI_05370 [Persicobacter diffluens]